jgi:citrate synthase
MKEEEVLFTIKKEHLDTGLRGFPVGHCVTSYVDAQKGLFYCDVPIEEVSHWEPIRVIYLLYTGKDGTEKEVLDFQRALKEREKLSLETIQAVLKLPRQGHPIHSFACALLLLGMFESAQEYREDCLRIIAKLPHLAALVMNHHAGWGKTPTPVRELGYMENFGHMLNVPNKDLFQLTEAFRLFNILHYDHGGGNLSAFVGKAVASGWEDLYGSLAAAMCALAGPKHGRANQESLEFVQSILSEVGEKATPELLENVLRLRMKDGQLLYGFGHAVLRVEDPRATILYDYVKTHYPEHPLVKIALLLRAIGTKVLIENPKVTNPYPNVDGVSGIMLTAAGFGYPVYYTNLFGLARSVGIAIQIVYERLEARGGKGTHIVRPKYLFKQRMSSN